MIAPRVKRLIIETPPEDDAEALQRALRKGMREAVQLWQREIAPKHFKFGAQGRYGYKRRSKKYRRRKKRVMGHQRPLVYTGNTQRWVTTRFAAPRIAKHAQGFSARLPVKVPKYFFMYRGTGPNKWDELTRTLPPEYEALYQRVDEHLDQAANRRKSKKLVVNLSA